MGIVREHGVYTMIVHATLIGVAASAQVVLVTTGSRCKLRSHGKDISLSGSDAGLPLHQGDAIVCAKGRDPHVVAVIYAVGHDTHNVYEDGNSIIVRIVKTSPSTQRGGLEGRPP